MDRGILRVRIIEQNIFKMYMACVIIYRSVCFLYMI